MRVKHTPRRVKHPPVNSSCRKKKLTALPPIPEKIYFTIGEVGQLCLLEPYVLRYWEQEFPQLKPTKRRGNRRYYTREEIVLIRNIRSLLYEQGFTISGARRRIEENKEIVIAEKTDSNELIKDVIGQLQHVLKDLENQI